MNSGGLLEGEEEALPSKHTVQSGGGMSPGVTGAPGSWHRGVSPAPFWAEPFFWWPSAGNDCVGPRRKSRR